MQRFKTFEGVFVPSLLSILGVIMYLRLGWVVGQVGLGGALVILILSNLISLATGLAISSTVTNIRIGHGGAYSIITKSLGLEAGGAIGIPLFFSQAISVAFYIVGFSECWISVFPGHNPWGIYFGTWLVMWGIALTSARLAFRVQFGILALIVLSLISIFGGQGLPAGEIRFWSGANTAEFLKVFAVFFPAVTGILAGVTMSGELTDPKRSIPRGTLGAIITSFVIYVGMALWLASHAPAGKLAENTSLIIDLGRWRWPIILGIMGATLSSALNMFVTAPRTLFALARNSVIPFSSSFVTLNAKGEPRAAILFTALISLITLMLGTLNQVANLLTMFFLITYATLNLSVFIEQTLGIPSFRPTFRVPRLVPLAGSAGCVIVMFLIDTGFTWISLTVIVLIYAFLMRRETRIYSPDVRSGMLTFLAEQMAKAAAKLPYHPKIWKPNLLIPVRRLADITQVIPVVHPIVYPSGRSIFCAVCETQTSVRDPSFTDVRRHGAKEHLAVELAKGVEALREEEIYVETTVVESKSFFDGALAALQAVKGMVLPPNCLFYFLDEDSRDDAVTNTFLKKAGMEGLGIIVFRSHPRKGLGQAKTVNLWIREHSPNADLSILVALQLVKNWEGTVRLIQVIDQEEHKAAALAYLQRLQEVLRLPGNATPKVMVGQFREIVSRAPEADVNMFGMPPREPDLTFIREIFAVVDTSVLFLSDSKHESVMA